MNPRIALSIPFCCLCMMNTFFANQSSEVVKLTFEQNVNEAIKCVEYMLEENPNNAEVLILHGELLMHAGKEQEAYQVLKNAAEHNPQDHVLRVKLANNLFWVGNNCYSRHETEQALEVYELIETLFPQSATVLHNLAAALAELNQPHEAIEIYQRALAVKPDDVGSNFGLGTAYLSVGDYKRGWQHYEWRWKKPGQTLDDLPYPIWDGSDLNNKTILLRTEGALGDSIQFVRYAQLIKNLGATVIVQTLAPLKKLFSGCPYIDALIAKHPPAMHVDWQVSLMSIPFVLDATVDTIPNNIPYLYVHDTLVQHWKNFLQIAGADTFNVGLCWQADLHNDLQRPPLARRSIPVNFFAPLANIPGVQLFSLQRGTDEKISFQLHTFDENFDKTNGRFMDTAALIKNLDLVISVDTSIAHLAGALGTPTWVLLPFKADWRWIVDRTDTPWYHNMWLFKKEKNGTWQQLIETIVEQLQSIIT